LAAALGVLAASSFPQQQQQQQPASRIPVPLFQTPVPSSRLTAWHGGAATGRRTCDQEVAGSNHPGQGAAAYNDSGQVVHTRGNWVAFCDPATQ